MIRSRPEVCFVAQNAYGALCGRPTHHSGGVEQQQSLLARWFAARGYVTSLVTWDEGQPDGVVVSGVRVVKMCRADEGIPGLRFFHPRWSSFWRALGRARADVYHYASTDLGLGLVALWCRGAGRLCFYSLSSTWGAEAGLPHLGPWRERVLYRFGLRNASRVVVQTHRQQAMLREGFGVESTVIPMPCTALTEAYTPPPPPVPGRARVLWVGRVSEEKRLEWLLDVARECPDVTFDVVGAPNANTPYAEAVLARARSVANVVLHGRVADRSELADSYKRSALLCCTSSSEGFPNTFLEAWSLGLPVVSTFDPDGVIARLGLGVASVDVTEIARGIRGLLRSSDRYGQASRNARRYYEEVHAVDRVLPRVESTLLNLYRGDGAPACSR